MPMVKRVQAWCDDCGAHWEGEEVETKNEMWTRLKANGWIGNVINVICPDCKKKAEEGGS